MIRIKTLLLFFFTLVSNFLFAQNKNFSTLITKGKEAYAKTEYDNTAEYFEKAILKIPNNAEAHYYLGYCYSKINSSDGKKFNTLFNI
ncbi:MAG: tetratricopeptide repeat protein [Bacteroidia bacterium]|nr:tetratricopeptide repeat protein [Bacteroidia bacterium]